MKPQLHINVSAPKPEKMESITQAGWQPNGGLWTFTDDASLESFSFWTAQFVTLWRWWIPTFESRYCEPGTQRLYLFKAWVLYPSPLARIAIIDSRDDLLDLGNRYGWVESCFERRVGGVLTSRMDGPVYTPNFLAMAEDFDALHVTDLGVERLEDLEAGEYRLAFWEAESTCWFRWCFDRVEDVGLLSKYKAPAHGNLFTILNRRRRSWIASGKTPIGGGRAKGND